MLSASKKLNCRIRLTLILSTVLFCGCYPNWPEQAGTAMVHGTISLDGSPVNQAKIVFVPVNLRNADEKLVPLAYGTTDVDGKFELEYSDGTQELFAGTYTVMISKLKQVDDSQNNANMPWPKDLLPDSVVNMFNDPSETIPSIYNLDSNLTYEIMDSPSINRPMFELTSIDPNLNEFSDTDSP